MAKKTPDEVLKKLDSMSDIDLKDAIVRTCIRQARAELDLAHFKETYGDVIKEEKEQRSAYLMALEIRDEAHRHRELAAQAVEDASGDEEKASAVEVLRLVQQGAQA